VSRGRKSFHVHVRFHTSRSGNGRDELGGEKWGEEDALRAKAGKAGDPRFVCGKPEDRESIAGNGPNPGLVTDHFKGLIQK
jgi:hypothetical protein